MPELLPRQPFKRVLIQHLTFKDPISEKNIEIKFSTVPEGELEGCPIIEIEGRLIIWSLSELAFEAVKIFREKGVLPDGSEKEEEVEEPEEKDFTGFSPVKDEEMIE